MWELELIPVYLLLSVGWKRTFVFSYKVYFVHCGNFCFFIIGNSGYETLCFALINSL